MAFALKGQTKVTMAFKVRKSYLSRFFFNSFQILRVGSLQKRKNGFAPWPLPSKAKQRSQWPLKQAFFLTTFMVVGCSDPLPVR